MKTKTKKADLGENGNDEVEIRIGITHGGRVGLILENGALKIIY